MKKQPLPKNRMLLLFYSFSAKLEMSTFLYHTIPQVPDVMLVGIKLPGKMAWKPFEPDVTHYILKPVSTGNLFPVQPAALFRTACISLALGILPNASAWKNPPAGGKKYNGEAG